MRGRRARRGLLWAAGLATSLGCAQPWDLVGRPCPCAEAQGYVCCRPTGRCVRPQDLETSTCPSAPSHPAQESVADAGGAYPPTPDAPPVPAPDAGATIDPATPDAPAMPADAAAACSDEPHGVRAFHWDDEGHAGMMVSRQAPTFSFEWPGAAPDPALAPDSEWSSVLAAHLQPEVSGDHTFFVEADDAFEMWIDQELLLSWGVPSPPGGHTIAARHPLVAGRRHAILVHHLNKEGPAHFRLTWAPPGGERGPIPACILYPGPTRPSNCADPFAGCYNHDRPFCTREDRGNGLDISFFSDPGFTKLEHKADVAMIILEYHFDWLKSPRVAPALRDTKFHIRWEGELRPPLGETFTFFLLADAETRLTIGDRELHLQPDASGVMKEAIMTMPLTLRGRYPIRIDYVQRDVPERSKIQLRWQSASMPRVEIDYCYLYGSAPPVVWE
jgi:hypothetical protein